MKNLVNKVIYYRYLLAFFVFLIGLSMNLHGSSISMWNSYGVSELSSGKQSTTTFDQWFPSFSKTDGVIWGTTRGIRSDEWLVQTPFFIAQTNTDEAFLNTHYGLSGENMVVAYNVPVRHISVIGKPFNWGALFLDSSHSISWYWCFKLITLLLLGFEFTIILTKGNKYLSLLGSFVITYTPTTQWWFEQHLGDVVWNSLLAMIAIHYFFVTNKLSIKILSSVFLSISLIGFTLVIYPAFQVVFAYVILFFFLIYFIRSVKGKRLKKIDWLIMGITLLFTGSVIGITILQSLEPLLLSLQTVYPGYRISTGGNTNLNVLISPFLNFLIPFKNPDFLNQVELSSSLSFLPFIIITIPFLFYKKMIKENLFAFCLILYSLFLYFYIFVGIPSFISKLLLFSFVTSERAWQAIAVLGVFISLWFINYVWEQKDKFNKWLFISLSIPIILVYFYLIIVERQYNHYLPKFYFVLYLGIYSLTYIAAILKKKKLFYTLMIFVGIFPGFVVNPLVHGLSAIEDKKLSIAIKKIVSEDKNAIWITDNVMSYQFPQMFGAKNLTGVFFYPDYKEMKIIDSKYQFKTRWNRYSHLKFILTKDSTIITNPAPDIVSVQLDTKKLTELNAKYIISSRDLSAEFGEKFQLIYGPDKDGNRIYKLLGKH